MIDIWVVLRLDLSLFTDDQSVTLKEVFYSQEEATEEVDRLSKINPKKNAIYFYRQGRIHKSPPH